MSSGRLLRVSRSSESRLRLRLRLQQAVLLILHLPTSTLITVLTAGIPVDVYPLAFLVTVVSAASIVMCAKHREYQEQSKDSG